MKTLPSGWSTYLDAGCGIFYILRVDTQDSTTYLWATVDTDDISSWTAARIYGNRLDRYGLGVLPQTMAGLRRCLVLCDPRADIQLHPDQGSAV